MFSAPTRTIKTLISLCFFSCCSVHPFDHTILPPAPTTIERFGEIATQYNTDLPATYNQLTLEERIFIYYMFRASLPGIFIFSDQLHRDAQEIAELFEYIRAHSLELQTKKFDDSLDISTFLQEAKIYLVYLWTNHSQYFLKEQKNEKRTPSRLGMTQLTPDHLKAVLQALDYPDCQNTITRLAPSLFQETIEPTLCTPGDLAHSAINMYARDFTAADFDHLPVSDRTKINNYFYITEEKGERISKTSSYKIGATYDQELRIAVYWLAKAHKHAQKHPALFDKHLVKSIELLIAFLKTGNEELFRRHSIEWLKSSSRINYTFGFIETYKDPYGAVGAFEADITIKSFDIKKLLPVLPEIEKKLPVDPAFQRENINDGTALPNASVNTKVFATGELGPLQITAAYCLPNYNDIRSKYGSKQIMYQDSGKSLGQVLNPKLYRMLFYPKEQARWLDIHDPNYELIADIWQAQCTLHETIGHGSGRLTTHTFTQNDRLCIGNTRYAPGDTITVTSENIKELVGNYRASLEELRAEIIALYASVALFDDLAAAGLYKDWPTKISKKDLEEWLIIQMCWTGLRRLLTQPDDSREIAGAHAQANTVIVNYLLDHGGIQLIQEPITYDSKQYTVLGFHIVSLEQIMASVKTLVREVQRITSTGDGCAAKILFETYGTTVRNPKHITILKQNWQAVVGPLKVSATIFPHYVPLLDKKGAIIDIAVSWPSNIIEQFIQYKKIALTKSLE
jgi:hypothetical protein